MLVRLDATRCLNLKVRGSGVWGPGGLYCVAVSVVCADRRGVWVPGLCPGYAGGKTT